MRKVNNNLRHLSEPSAHSEPVAFFCECQNPSCYSPVWISLAAYDAIVEDRRAWLPLESHEACATLFERKSEITPTNPVTLRATSKWSRTPLRSPSTDTAASTKRSRSA